MILFNGTMKSPGGQPISGVAGATFSLYESEEGGAPLWMETQNVQGDETGHYAVRLGATKSEGLTLDLFTSGVARWLGVSINGGPEQPRVLLLSVPYALKAADAQTVGGLPPSAFVLATPEAANGAPLRSTSSPAAPAPAVGGGGSMNFIPVWTDGLGDLGNSVVYQLGTGATAKVGINTTTPISTLDVKGGVTIRGLLGLPPTGIATVAAGKVSEPLNLTGSAFNSGTAAAVSQTFRWQTEPAANDTPTPSGTLNLLFGADGGIPAETGLSIASNGQIAFASGQTFPGAGGGTITGVLAGTDLTGGGSSGTITLNVDTTKVAQLNGVNSFNGNQSIGGNLSTTGNISATGDVSSGTATFVGNNATQIERVTQTGTGTALLVQQNDTGSTPEIALFASAGGKSAVAVEAQATNGVSGASGIAVSGAAFGSAGVGVFGSANNVSGGAGVVARANSTTGGVGVNAIATSATGIAAVLDNIGGGEILSARHNGSEVFSVDGAGNMQATGNITTQGGQAIIRSAAVPGVFTNTAGGTILVGQNNTTQKFSFDGNGNLVTAGSVSAASFSGSGSGLTDVARLNVNNTFLGNQNITGNLVVGSPTSSAVLQLSGKDATGTGVQNQTINTSTSGTSFAVFAATSSAGVTTEMVADGLGKGPLATPSGYFGTFTNQPIGFITGNTPRMIIQSGGNVGIGTLSPGALLEADAPANSGEVAISARGGSTSTLLNGANAIVTTGGLNSSSSGQGGFGISATGGLAIGPQGTGGNGVVGMGGQASGANLGANGGDGGDFIGGTSSNSAGGNGITAFAGSGAGRGYGADIIGDLNVSGAIFAGTKDFKIDHPLDPANQYLFHGSVESSELLNIYTGNITTDSGGEALVVLPRWFQELNADFRYQLTVVGQFAQAIVAKEISNNQFTIKTDKPSVKVSWQVTCVRQDAYAKAHPLEVEKPKPESERGYYLYPELYGAPEEKGVEWASHPQMMKRIREMQHKQ